MLFRSLQVVKVAIHMAQARPYQLIFLVKAETVRALVLVALLYQWWLLLAYKATVLGLAVEEHMVITLLLTAGAVLLFLRHTKTLRKTHI